MRRIVLTGGGSAGHVTPNLALLPGLRRMGFEVYYIGTREGIERELVEKAGIPYYPIDAGKFRRYFDVKNLTDPFRVLHGLGQAVAMLRRLKPDVIFSKGGFVSGPVIVAGWLNRIPSVIHESDMTPGIANRLSIPFATKVCFTFPETEAHLPAKKRIWTGTPVREELLKGSAGNGLRLCGFKPGKPVLLVMGGSLGATSINRPLRQALKTILREFQVCHICGKKGLDPSLDGVEGYRQFEYVGDGLADIFACTDVIVSRAGSNSIHEFLALRKPSLLIPLSLGASRGDQIQNAESFSKQGFSKVLRQEELNPDTLVQGIRSVYADRQSYIEAMERSRIHNGVEPILDVISKIAVHPH